MGKMTSILDQVSKVEAMQDDLKTYKNSEGLKLRF